MSVATNHELVCGFLKPALVKRLRQVQLLTGEPVAVIVRRSVEEELARLENVPRRERELD